MNMHDEPSLATFFIHGMHLTINTNSQETILNMAQECGYFQVPCSDKADFTVYAIDASDGYGTGKSGICDIIDLEKGQDCFYYDIDAMTHLIVNIRAKKARIVSTNAASLPFFVWQVSESLILAVLRERGIPCMHAAALEKDGMGILFPAMVCSGKTTLTIELVRKGYRYLADDLVFIDNNLEALCFPTRIGVTEYTGMRFADLISKENTVTVPYSKKKYFRLDSVFPGSIAHKCKPAFIMFPSPGPETGIKKVSKAKALTKLIPSMYNDNEFLSNFHQVTGFDKSTIFERAADLINATTQFELTVGDTGLEELIRNLS